MDIMSVAVAKALSGNGGGSGGGVLVVHDVDGTLDKTWNEINAADAAVIVSSGGNEEIGLTFINRCYVSDTFIMGDSFHVGSMHAQGVKNYVTSNPDDYPVFSDQ